MTAVHFNAEKKEIGSVRQTKTDRIKPTEEKKTKKTKMKNIS